MITRCLSSITAWQPGNLEFLAKARVKYDVMIMSEPGVDASTLGDSAR